MCQSTIPGYNLKEALESHLTLGGVTYIKQRKEQRIAGLGEGEHVTARDNDSEYLGHISQYNLHL